MIALRCDVSALLEVLCSRPKKTFPHAARRLRDGSTSNFSLRYATPRAEAKAPAHFDARYRVETSVNAQYFHRFATFLYDGVPKCVAFYHRHPPSVHASALACVPPTTLHYPATSCRAQPITAALSTIPQSQNPSNLKQVTSHRPPLHRYPPTLLSYA